MTHVGIDCSPESLFATFHKVTSTTAVSVHVYSAWDHIAAFGVDYLCIDNMKVNV